MLNEQPSQNSALEYEMVLIKGGQFLMGSPETEKGRWSHKERERQHWVTINDFEMGKYLVTQAQWQAVMGDSPTCIRSENIPVTEVSWWDVQQFISQLNDKTGQNYRLATEEELEYACRAGTTTPYYTGNGVTRKEANFTLKPHPRPTPVGAYPPNGYGLYDMIGNVNEWTSSDAGVYGIIPFRGEGKEASWIEELLILWRKLFFPNKSTPWRVVRGGSWLDKMYGLRSAQRCCIDLVVRSPTIGFRLAKDVKP